MLQNASVAINGITAHIITSSRNFIAAVALYSIHNAIRHAPTIPTWSTVPSFSQSKKIMSTGFSTPALCRQSFNAYTPHSMEYSGSVIPFGSLGYLVL